MIVTNHRSGHNTGTNTSAGRLQRTSQLVALQSKFGERSMKANLARDASCTSTQRQHSHTRRQVRGLFVLRSANAVKSACAVKTRRYSHQSLRSHRQQRDRQTHMMCFNAPVSSLLSKRRAERAVSRPISVGICPIQAHNNDNRTTRTIRTTTATTRRVKRSYIAA